MNPDRILVVAAHPDDEVLGCGATIARCAADGAAVHILIVGQGATARTGGGAKENKEEIEALQAAARAAALCLGVSPPLFGGLPDNRLDSLHLLDVVQRIEDVVVQVQPETVYTHHGGDLNIDHRIVHQAVVTACRPLPGATVRRLYAFETVSSTEWSGQGMGGSFHPARYVDISEYLDLKLKALDCYTAEMRPFPHARSRENVANLARVRGASVGLEAAEAFAVVREIAP